MDKVSFNRLEDFAQKYVRRGGCKVLDVGSRIVFGQEGFGSPRDIFNRLGCEYVGLDIEAGVNVDVVSDPYKYPFSDGEFDAVVSSNTFEHTKFPWVVIREMARVLKPGGYCYVMAPSHFYQHRYPIDTFRFYPDGMEALAEWADLSVVKVRRIYGDKRKEQYTYMVARKDNG